MAQMLKLFVVAPPETVAACAGAGTAMTEMRRIEARAIRMAVTFW